MDIGESELPERSSLHYLSPLVDAGMVRTRTEVTRDWAELYSRWEASALGQAMREVGVHEVMRRERNI